MREIYPVLHNREVAEIFGCSTKTIEYNASKRLKIRKTKECRRDQVNATRWTPAMITFLRENFFTLTNQQLADALGTRLTVLRNKTRELGLCRHEVDNWTEPQIAFLLANYPTMGDVEIKENLQLLYPRKKPWVRGHIHKKLKLLQLARTPEQIAAIVAKHVQPGGRSYTIDRNSSSANMHDKWVVGRIAWRDKATQEVLLKMPEVIELKRQEIILKRTIKEAKNA